MKSGRREKVIEQMDASCLQKAVSTERISLILTPTHQTLIPTQFFGLISFSTSEGSRLMICNTYKNGRLGRKKKKLSVTHQTLPIFLTDPHTRETLSSSHPLSYFHTKGVHYLSAFIKIYRKKKFLPCTYRRFYKYILILTA